MNESIKKGNDVRMHIIDNFWWEFASYSLQLFDMFISCIFVLYFSF